MGRQEGRCNGCVCQRLGLLWEAPKLMGKTFQGQAEKRAVKEREDGGGGCGLTGSQGSGEEVMS